jgi:Arc/MetJ-type ribon-helix-helix transcriptional regulator
MQLPSIKPEIERFIDDQVTSGSFTSREAVVEAAIRGMMREQEASEPDDEDIAAINEAEAQIDRGEFVEFSQFAADMRKKFCNP